MSSGPSAKKTVLRVYERMIEAYGPQHWWPAQTRFEVMVGAVLTQSAAWSNVEKAVTNLEAAGALTPAAIRDLPRDELARLVYSSGYYNAKARRLQALAEYLGRRFADDLDAMGRQEVAGLRRELLGVHGVGEETADDILLYALGKPVFVVDAYTRRIFCRLGLSKKGDTYSGLRDLFMGILPRDTGLYGEYHALIVVHGKDVCRRVPLCGDCCLLDMCPTGQASSA